MSSAAKMSGLSIQSSWSAILDISSGISFSSLGTHFGTNCILSDAKFENVHYKLLLIRLSASN